MIVNVGVIFVIAAASGLRMIPAGWRKFRLFNLNYGSSLRISNWACLHKNQVMPVHNYRLRVESVKVAIQGHWSHSHHNSIINSGKFTHSHRCDRWNINFSYLNTRSRLLSYWKMDYCSGYYLSSYSCSCVDYCIFSCHSALSLLEEN